MPVPQPASAAEARDRRAKEIIQAAYNDQYFMSQIHQSMMEEQRGEPAVPLRDLQAQERAIAAS